MDDVVPVGANGCETEGPDREVREHQPDGDGRPRPPARKAPEPQKLLAIPPPNGAAERDDPQGAEQKRKTRVDPDRGREARHEHDADEEEDGGASSLRGPPLVG